jgi:hypothetical protein
VCSAGECSAICQEELDMCDGRCVDVESDRFNCGDCERPCDAGYLCDRGACVLQCPPGESDCVARCVDVLHDRVHCGDCATRCADGQDCFDGVCQATCSPGLVDCTGSCVDVDHDPANCGDCGVLCGDAEGCVDGACRAVSQFCRDLGLVGWDCPTGMTEFCYGAPLDPSSATQAQAACEACYGDTCYDEDADCAGNGFGPNPRGSYRCGDGYFGYEAGCSGAAGRVWSICSSFTTYGNWAP